VRVNHKQTIVEMEGDRSDIGALHRYLSELGGVERIFEELAGSSET
jgi:hypothetical protein